MNIYDPELQERGLNWRYKFKIGQSISGIQKPKIESNCQGHYYRRRTGPKTQNLQRFRCLGDKEKPADEIESHSKRSTMEMHHPNSPSRKDLFPSLRKYGQQTATAVSYFRISLNNRDHPGKKHALL